MLFHEHGVNIVEQFGLFLSAGAFSGNVIEENGKRTDAEAVHLLEFVHQIVAVFRRPTNVSAGMYGPVEIDSASVGAVHQFAQLIGLFLRIGVAPMLAMIGVVLRTVDIDVQFVVAVEIELAQAVLVAPRATVKALDGSTIGHIGPVLHGANFHLALGHHLAQGLYTIIKAAFVTSHHHGALRFHGQVVAFGVGGHEFLVFGHSFLAHHTQRDAVVGTSSLRTRHTQFVQSVHCIGLRERIARRDFPLLGSREQLSVCFDRLRSRIHIRHLRRHTAAQEG